jgi:hypothetical protein
MALGSSLALLLSIFIDLFTVFSKGSFVQVADRCYFLTTFYPSYMIDSLLGGFFRIFGYELYRGMATFPLMIS